MRLLIITQKVDKNDPILGFFHRWIEEFAKHCESLVVICLEEGESRLPQNVKVMSLGKEGGHSRLKYVFRFYKYIWSERKNYDAVFVHMNQEYVILGWKLWKILGKKIWFWRNHAKGNLLTRMSVWVSDRVFCTSPESYTARFKKTEIMPVGIDTEFFKPDSSVVRVPGSILFLGRISPVKKVLEFVEQFKNTDYVVTIAGPILGADQEYGDKVLRALSPNIRYTGPVDQVGALRLYQSHEFYANKTPAGSFDKTILEALACGCKMMVDNQAAKNLSVDDHDLKKLVSKVLKEL